MAQADGDGAGEGGDPGRNPGESGVSEEAKAILERVGPDPSYDGLAVAKGLLRAVRAGALATLDRAAGFPFATLVTVATDVDGAPLFLMSRLSGHTANLAADPRASVLLAERGKGDPLAHPRLTVIGRITPTDDPRARARFLARHPKAKLYAGFGDFAVFRMDVEGAHLNGGFARAMAIARDDLLTRIDDARSLLALEESAVAHMNEDHRDALALYATRLGKAPQADWHATGIDPDGLDLAAGDLTARVPFPERIAEGGRLRRVLKEMADRARGMEG
ncbi:HugZ family pyridoxamine 5'-phosphate oxidase [Salinarimonas chemoclinalis]|uniref:HugZ family pyridoxamine 5'-phosphate oxidase n=1 Tax=Salinarimonas chemoclinalis TaxID=3241599 RepID=UPI0035569D0C